MISFAILVRFYRRPLSVQYLTGGAASSLAQIHTHRKRAREGGSRCLRLQGRAKCPSLIFTFNPENTVRQSFIEQTLSLISKHSARVEFVEMLCEESGLENRLDTPERCAYKKMLSVTDHRELRNRNVSAFPVMAVPQMGVHTTQQSPREAAVQIVEGLGLPLSSERAE